MWEHAVTAARESPVAALVPGCDGQHGSGPSRARPRRSPRLSRRRCNSGLSIIRCRRSPCLNRVRGDHATGSSVAFQLLLRLSRYMVLNKRPPKSSWDRRGFDQGPPPFAWPLCTVRKTPSPALLRPLPISLRASDGMAGFLTLSLPIGPIVMTRHKPGYRRGHQFASSSNDR